MFFYHQSFRRGRDGRRIKAVPDSFGGSQGRSRGHKTWKNILVLVLFVFRSYQTGAKSSTPFYRKLKRNTGPFKVIERNIQLCRIKNLVLSDCLWHPQSICNDARGAEDREMTRSVWLPDDWLVSGVSRGRVSPDISTSNDAVYLLHAILSRNSRHPAQRGLSLPY